MKSKKGFTLIELLICGAIIGLILALAVPNISRAREKNKAKEYAKKHGGYTMPVQQVKEQIRSSRISISEVGDAGNITYYIVKDLNNGQEYLIGKLIQAGDRAGLAITKMEPTK